MLPVTATNQKHKLAHTVVHKDTLMKLLDKAKLFFARRKSKKDADKATELDAPYIRVLDIGFNDGDVSQGYFELDWNSLFVQQLQEAGYSGRTDEEVVNLWFNDLCRSIAQEQENG